jgi:hypothetical protein
MARNSESIDALIAAAVGDAMSRIAPRIAKFIADAAASQLEADLQVNKTSGRGRRPAGAGTRSRQRAEITKWVADRNARRVPNFVIEMVSLDTKKKIVAKYGEGATFEKGKPVPKPKADGVKAADGKKPKEAAKLVAEK